MVGVRDSRVIVGDPVVVERALLVVGDCAVPRRGALALLEYDVGALLEKGMGALPEKDAGAFPVVGVISSCSSLPCASNLDKLDGRAGGLPLGNPTPPIAIPPNPIRGGLPTSRGGEPTRCDGDPTRRGGDPTSMGGEEPLVGNISSASSSPSSGGGGNALSMSAVRSVMSVHCSRKEIKSTRKRNEKHDKYRRG